MKKLLLLSISLIFSNISLAQVIQARVLDIEPMNLAKMKSAVAEKTKLFNSKKGTTRFSTFEILSGPNANNLWRVQHGNEIGDFDSSVSSQELDYWWKMTGKLHTPLANRFWYLNKDATYIPEGYKRLNYRRVIIYKLIPGKEKDFWRYRTRLVNAMKEAGCTNTVGVMSCMSGCNGNWVMVRYHHTDLSSMQEENSNMFSKVVEKYNQIYGEESYEDDYTNIQLSVSENISHFQKLLPELSSP